jgi:hypothetical protein
MPEELHPLHLRGKTLEDLFFFKQDLALTEKKRLLQKMGRNLETLAGISGITNEVILQKLTQLNIQVEVLATLSIIPLVEVAWADGKIDNAEREAILSGAESYGVFKGHINRSLFEHWLQNQPPKEMIESWIFYMQGLCQLLDESERRALKLELLQRARRVVEAACGLKKKRSKVSRRKEEVLLKLERAFEL